MTEAICPHCSENLYSPNRIRKDGKVVNCIPVGGSGFIDDPGAFFTFAVLTCPSCNKILGAVNSSAIPVPGSAKF